MKGDFTRSTFKPDKHYSSVRMQQGRVQLDADWNEQMDINSHRIEKEASDIIGPCGVPWNEKGGGFKISASGNNLTISQGNIYVDGILCENPESINITDQEDLPDFKNFNTFSEGTYLAYLDVWKSHITAIEDPQIREVALGGPDTATRTKTVWQVKLEKLKKDLKLVVENGQIDCKEVSSGWKTIIDRKIEKREAKLAAFTKQETPSTNPCVIPAGAGYRRLENQLYRVEIHKGGNLNQATFKWSRDNGSVVFAIEEFSKDASGNLTRFKIRQPGKDKSLSLAKGDWVEILDDATELSENSAGMLAQITESPDVSGRIFGLNQSISGYDMDRHPRVRRWDLKSGAMSVTPEEGDSIELEDGIRVKFSGNKFRAGDYWLIPARTATENTQETGKIEWPQDESKTPPEPKAMPPEGIEHHYCLLAVVQFATSQGDNGGNKWTTTDYRKVFPAVTELTSFFHVCGDGQEAMPGEELPLPLQVGVSNGKWPVKDAFVKFEIKSGGGKLSAKNPVNNNPLIVKTDPEGMAECTWELGTLDLNNPNVPPSQLIEARLLDVCNNTINTPLRFNANLSMASQVAYTLPDCPKDTTNEFSTVKRLFEKKTPSWPPANESGNISVEGILDSFLCDFNASHLPLDNDLCSILSNAGVKTVQDALNVLCKEIVGGDGGGCCIVVADTKQLLKALDELKDGSTICLLAGEFKVEKLLIENLNNIVIRGCNHASKLIGLISIADCQNLVMENLDISGSIFAKNTSNFSLRKNKISQSNGQGFRLTECPGTIIESNLFEVEGELVSEGSNDLKIQNNVIERDLSKSERTDGISPSVLVIASSAVEITGNRIQLLGDKEIIERTNAAGIWLEKIGGEEGNHVSIACNRVSALNGPALNIQSYGTVRVHGNYFTSRFRILGTKELEEDASNAIKILSPESRIIFTDNFCDSESNEIKDDADIFLINIEGKDTIFSNNNCTFMTIAESSTSRVITHAYIHILLRSRSVASIIGNRCSEENMNAKIIYSIFAGEIFENPLSENSIVIGNIATHNIKPLPDPSKLNLQNT